MNGEHLDPERRGGADGTGDSVRDVVKSQIEKNLRLPFLLRLRDNLLETHAGGEKFQSQLEKPHPAAQLPDEFQCRTLIRHIDGGDNSVFRRGRSCHSFSPMNRVARAKINLSLRILRKRVRRDFMKLTPSIGADIPGGSTGFSRGVRLCVFLQRRLSAHRRLEPGCPRGAPICRAHRSPGEQPHSSREENPAWGRPRRREQRCSGRSLRVK